MGYHAWTFGWIIGEIVRRADGRSLVQVTQEEHCRPLGIDSFFLGILDEVESRVAGLRQEPPVDEQTRLAKLAMPRGFTNGETANLPDVHRASVPGAGGITNARAIARHYAMLACAGALDGVRILSARHIHRRLWPQRPRRLARLCRPPAPAGLWADEKPAKGGPIWNQTAAFKVTETIRLQLDSRQST